MYISILYNLTLIQKTKIPRSLSQVTAYNHHNVFTFIPLLLEGRTGGAWEPCNKMMLFLQPHNKVVSHFFPLFFILSTLLLYFLPLFPSVPYVDDALNLVLRQGCCIAK
jgi:hypothetical protein